MKAGLWIVVATIVFWAVWAGLAGLVTTIHGDCGVGATQLEAAACVREKGRVGLAALAVGAVPYGLMVWRLLKRSRNRGRPGG